MKIKQLLTCLGSPLRVLGLAAVLAGLPLVPGVAWAAPGAHGPGGEHLDGPSAVSAAGSVPRIEAKSEQFELVGQLFGGELSILIDRYASNEPVLNAALEVEFGKLKVVAKFHADHGDYSVDDAAFLAALSKPGEHALVFTIVAGKDSDLLDGVLPVSVADANAGNDHGHDHGIGHLGEALLLGLAALGVLAAAAWWLRRRKQRNTHLLLKASS